MSSTTSSSSGSCTTRVSTPPSSAPELETNDSRSLPPEPLRLELFSKFAVRPITIRNSRGAEFHVPRQLLAEASPLMENWTAPSPGRKDPVSIIELPTGEMVETLLRLCHPLAPAPHFPTLDAMKGALTLGWEYELRGGARDRVARALEPWLETEPVRLYVFAVEEDKLELMAVAARASLRLAGTLADHEELDAISTRAYRRLLTYRGACAAKMADIASYGAVDDRKWDSGMEDALKEAGRCSSKGDERCGTRAWKDLPGFLEELASEVDRRISELRFPGIGFVGYPDCIGEGDHPQRNRSMRMA
ncbi:uncharacterized protein TRAVEDRAFT_20406 [Trametes versicolor FP-101664 SS1]|uniref:uncharacterized protein n=1 Tax=Trametes versicolor (strain FP-101664) TaxID=717944 RepID=UPI0004621500|nr:uncharacterized protein TRAVEDRAFT_20406 [Trametes versicolor FP-101664 SS1]EIW58382.1 hypothetical protein TRAVEDRAFT_20406 [Trametes versicolor FP-101664 SS1]